MDNPENKTDLICEKLSGIEKHLKAVVNLKMLEIRLKYVPQMIVGKDRNNEKLIKDRAEEYEKLTRECAYGKER